MHTTVKIATFKNKSHNVYFHTSYSQASGTWGPGVVGFSEKLLRESKGNYKVHCFCGGQITKAFSSWRFCCCSRRNNLERSAGTRSSYLVWQLPVQVLASLCSHSHAAWPSQGLWIMMICWERHSCWLWDTAEDGWARSQAQLQWQSRFKSTGSCTHGGMQCLVRGHGHEPGLQVPCPGRRWLGPHGWVHLPRLLVVLQRGWGRASSSE